MTSSRGDARPSTQKGRPAAESAPIAAWRAGTRTPEQTHALGVALGRVAPPGTAVLLFGDLGSGKTVIAKGVAAGLGVPAVVNSPTFVLVNEYLSGRLPFLHADFYRLHAAAEVQELALAEAAQGGVLVVEWPERAPDDLPPDRLSIHIESGPGETDRTLLWQAEGALSRDVLHQLRALHDAAPDGD